MNVINIKDVEKKCLHKREIRVLIGPNVSLESDHMTFGVATVAPKTKMDSHMHLKEEEIIYILSGHGYVEVDGMKEDVEEGTAIKLPVKSSHYIHNESDTEMNFTFCFNFPLVIGSYDKK